MEVFSPMRWEDGTLQLLDQLQLPGEECWRRCETDAEVATAIVTMQVRGAPAIGCAAAYGMALAALRFVATEPRATHDQFCEHMAQVKQRLGGTRPTAVNLFWALAAMQRVIDAGQGSPPGETARALETKAVEIHKDDINRCLRIGDFGAPLIPSSATVLTHCNAGALATGGFGTALGVIRAAGNASKTLRILANETRPYLQGARLTAWELARENYDVTVLPDSAAAFIMAKGDVTCVIVGADRVAANGDVANKIGTYALALAAQQHQVPFYVAAPTSTIDWDTNHGSQIPIEERQGDEVLVIAGTRIAPVGVAARYPAFDVTPSRFVTKLITDQGVVEASPEGLQRLRPN